MRTGSAGIDLNEREHFLKYTTRPLPPPCLIIPKLWNVLILPFQICFYKTNSYSWQWNRRANDSTPRCVSVWKQVWAISLCGDANERVFKDQRFSARTVNRRNSSINRGTRDGSFFTKSKLPLNKLLHCIYFWSPETPIVSASTKLGVKPGSHDRHKHKHKINTKTKHDFSSGTCEDKTTRIFLFFRLLFCSWLMLKLWSYAYDRLKPIYIYIYSFLKARLHRRFLLWSFSFWCMRLNGLTYECIRPSVQSYINQHFCDSTTQSSQK